MHWRWFHIAFALKVLYYLISKNHLRYLNWHFFLLITRIFVRGWIAFSALAIIYWEAACVSLVFCGQNLISRYFWPMIKVQINEVVCIHCMYWLSLHMLLPLCCPNIFYILVDFAMCALDYYLSNFSEKIKKNPYGFWFGDPLMLSSWSLQLRQACLELLFNIKLRLCYEYQTTFNPVLTFPSLCDIFLCRYDVHELSYTTYLVKENFLAIPGFVFLLVNHEFTYLY